MRNPLARAALTHGYMPRLLVIESQTDPRAKLLQEVTANRYQAVVVSPLLSLEPQSYAASAPGCRFLLVEDPLQLQVPPNARRLVFNREDSFRTAGKAAGISLREGAGGAASSTLASRIGVLVSSHPPGTPQELDAFTAGVAGALDGGAPVIRNVADPVDHNALKAAIEQMRGQGIEIFLLFLGTPDSWCLDVMRDTGGSAIVSDWKASGAFARQVFLSIESDVPAGIAMFLSNIRAPDQVLNGPVRLMSGNARPIPAEVAAEVRRE